MTEPLPSPAPGYRRRLSSRQIEEARYYDIKTQAHPPNASHPLALSLDRYPVPGPWLNVGFVQALEALGHVKDRLILDIACGDGRTAVWLAMAGARVIGVDVSAESLSRARERAERNTVADRTAFYQVPGEDLALAFGHETFDGAFGYSAMHHIDVPVLSSNLASVLRADGVAAFPFEPVAFSRQYDRLRKSRLGTMFSAVGCETQDEIIIYGDDLKTLDKWFEVTITPFHLTTQLTAVVKPTQGWMRFLERLLGLSPTSENGYQELFWQLAAFDRAVLSRIRHARLLCRSATIVLRRPTVERL